MSILKEGINRVKDVEQVDRANKKLGRKVFKNTNGVINNAAGRSKIAKARILSDYEPGNNDRTAQLESRGHVELGKVIDDETISTIQDRYEELLDSEHAYPLREYDGEVYSRAVSRIHERIPELGDLLTDELGEIVRDYYGSYVDVKHLHAWRNYHAPDEILRETEIYSDSWHCDGMVTDVVKLFVNLSDVTEADGPFHILSRDYSRKLVTEGYERNRERMPDEFVDEEFVTKATGPAGTGLVCTTWNCFHRAGHIDEGHTRDIIQFQFVPSSEPLPADPTEWLDDVRVHPSEKRKITGD
jgi:hypothetical protein